MVGGHVGVEIRFLVEPLVAIRVGAAEWFLASVDPHMCLQVEVKREPLSTLLALVWLFSLLKQIR